VKEGGVQEQPVGDDLLTPAGVAALLFVERKTVARWAASGELSSVRTPSGHRRFLRSDVMAIRADAYQRHDQGNAVPSPRDGTTRDALQDVAPSREAVAAAVVADAVALASEAEAAEAAESVTIIARAAAAAAQAAARAAHRARGARALAANEAAKAVARDAARTAVRVHIRADVAAREVARAAALAVEELVATSLERKPRGCVECVPAGRVS
jgi:excisionase family DNA binding protein